MTTLHAVSVVDPGDCVNPGNALGAPSGTWTGNDDGARWSARWRLDTPPGPLEGTQTLQVTVRKSASGGNGDPEVDVEVWANGEPVATLASGVAVASTAGVQVGGTFDGTGLTGPFDVLVDNSAMGGMAAGRRSAQIDAATFTVQVGEEPSEQHEQGGSNAAVTVSAEGAGQADEQQHEQGGADAAVSVAAEGAGDASEAAQDGSNTSVVVSPTGGGTAAESASDGSTGTVTVSATGGGTAGEEQHATGGATASVTVTSEAVGTPFEFAGGGSDTTVVIVSTGGGQAEGQQTESGGSPALLTVTADGQGTGSEHPSAGSHATVTITATGAGEVEGQQQEAGGNAAHITVTGFGGGAGHEAAQDGSSSSVTVTVTGAGVAWWPGMTAPVVPAERTVRVPPERVDRVRGTPRTHKVPAGRTTGVTDSGRSTEVT